MFVSWKEFNVKIIESISLVQNPKKNFISKFFKIYSWYVQLRDNNFWYKYMSRYINISDKSGIPSFFEHIVRREFKDAKSFVSNQ